MKCHAGVEFPSGKPCPKCNAKLGEVCWPGINADLLELARLRVENERLRSDVAQRAPLNELQDRELTEACWNDLFAHLDKASPGFARKWKERFTKLRTTLTSTPSAAQRAPDGFALVPLIPTPKMVEIGCENNPTIWTDETDDDFAATVANDIYVSMVRTVVTSTDQKCTCPPDYWTRGGHEPGCTFASTDGGAK